jgi:microcystin-dependent protein
VISFGGAAAPDGWILCNGQALDGEDARYAALFDAIGTTWGNGSTGAGAQAGITDFNVPDLRGQFVRGLDDGRGVDPGRALSSTPQSDAIKSHTHGVNDPGHSHRMPWGHPPAAGIRLRTVNHDHGERAVHVPALTGISIRRSARRNASTNVAMRYIIKLDLESERRSMTKSTVWKAGPLCLLAALALGVAARTAADRTATREAPRLVHSVAISSRACVPVTSPVTVTFTIHDAPTGGARLWGPETHTITPAAGEFSVMLGSAQRLSPSIVEGGDAYVEVAIGSAVLGRQRLGAVPYALRAENGVPPGTIVSFGASRSRWGGGLRRSCSLGRGPRTPRCTSPSASWAMGRRRRRPSSSPTFGTVPSGAHASSTIPMATGPSGRHRCTDGPANHPAPTLSDGAHGHEATGYAWRGAGPGSGLPRRHHHPFTQVTVPKFGNHVHTVGAGGDPETRPRNVAVNYIIALMRRSSTVPMPTFRRRSGACRMGRRHDAGRCGD